MKSRHFKCTCCGKCCYGVLPLTVGDAWENSGRFPLGISWTPVHSNNRAYELVSKIGAVVRLPNRKDVAFLVSPVAYIPASFPCPALSAQNLCSIHDEKPLRCRAMPFYAYREESDQADMLVPRKDWLCDVSENAPVVYSDKVIIDRADFDAERGALIEQAPLLKKYVEKMISHHPEIMNLLIKAAVSSSGRFVVNFFPFLRLNRKYNLVEFAKKQYPVLKEYEGRVAGVDGLEEFERFYREGAEELEWFARHEGNEVRSPLTKKI